VNLKLKRLVRTSSSEQYALFDLDEVDDEDGIPATIGKLDLHFTSEGVYGTLLLWNHASGDLDESVREDFIYALLDEVSQPMGVPNEYVVEYFAPTLDAYSVFHNVGLEDEEAGGQEAEETEVDSGQRPDRDSAEKLDTEAAAEGAPESDGMETANE
jgi:hypothetical protein